jgi:hypothetical protein
MLHGKMDGAAPKGQTVKSMCMEFLIKKYGRYTEMYGIFTGMCGRKSSEKGKHGPIKCPLD